MPRNPRRYQLQRSLIFHVINRGILKQPIYHEESDFFLFLETLKRYIDREKAFIYHWCLMPNHYHIVMELLDPLVLSKIVGGWQQVYAVKYHRRYQTAGRLFQNRFKSQAIEKESYLLACGRYVERNPVRAGLCEKPWEWPWSSAKFYVEGKDDLITTPDPMWKEKTSEEYIGWLMQDSPEDEKLFKSNIKIVGREEFQKRLLQKNGRLIWHRTGRRRKTQL